MNAEKIYPLANISVPRLRERAALRGIRFRVAEASEEMSFLVIRFALKTFHLSLNAL